MRVKDSGQFKRWLQVRIGVELYDQASRLAHAEGKTLSQLVRELLERVIVGESKNVHALRELARSASMVQNSTDRDHWERLDRAIEQAEDVLGEETSN